MPRQKNIRKTNKTVLIVGEGATEVAFLQHLSRLFNRRECGVTCTIRNANGKGPEHILRHTQRLAGSIPYDHRVAFLDNDVPIPDKDKSKAKSQGIEILLSDHCIEYFLLRLLGKSPPNETKSCKRMIKNLGIDLLNSADYEKHFTKPVLEQQQDRFPTLRRLIEIMSGP